MNDGRRESIATVQNVEPSAVIGMEELTRRTIVDFGDQWKRYRDNPGYYGSLELLTDIIEPLLPVGAIAGARVAEIGSGSGRIVNMLLDAGAAHVTAIEPSEAMQVLRSNTASRAERITNLHVRGDALPPHADQDIVVAIGVLHHIPKPDAVVDAAIAALRPGGTNVRLALWPGRQRGLFAICPPAARGDHQVAPLVALCVFPRDERCA